MRITIETKDKPNKTEKDRIQCQVPDQQDAIVMIDGVLIGTAKLRINGHLMAKDRDLKTESQTGEYKIDMRIY